MQQASSAPMSTMSVLNGTHTAYRSSVPFPLEASTSLVVNTWVTAESGGTVDGELATRALEHARRRAEDGCIILGYVYLRYIMTPEADNSYRSLHPSTPSLLAPFISVLPLAVPQILYTALDTLKPFLHTATPHNPSLPRYCALAATFTVSLAGDITGASLSLSTSGIDTHCGLLDVPAEKGYRAFDVFYYLLTSSSPQEREYLGLRQPSQYALLRKSETYNPPSYIPTADDTAAAEDFRDSLNAIGVRGRSM